MLLPECLLHMHELRVRVHVVRRAERTHSSISCNLIFVATHKSTHPLFRFVSRPFGARSSHSSYLLDHHAALSLWYLQTIHVHIDHKQSMIVNHKQTGAFPSPQLPTPKRLPFVSSPVVLANISSEPAAVHSCEQSLRINHVPCTSVLSHRSSLRFHFGCMFAPEIVATQLRWGCLALCRAISSIVSYNQTTRHAALHISSYLLPVRTFDLW